MSFIVEDGSVVTGANSYVSVSFADSYFSDRGISAWVTLTTTAKEQALVKGTDYIEQMYALSFNGYVVSDEQSLSFPRTGIYVNGGILSSSIVPTRLKQAVSELAVKSLSGDLMPDVERQVKREKIDVIETEYSDNAINETYKATVSRLIAPYLMSSGGVGYSIAKVVR